MTLSETIRAIERVAKKQPSVKSVVRSDIFRLNAIPDAEYGVFGWTQGQHSANIGSSLYTYRFTFFYIDRMTHDQGNQVEVQSVGVATLDNIVRGLGEIGVEFDGECRFTTFNQRFMDECAGVFCSVSLLVPLAGVCAEEFADDGDFPAFRPDLADRLRGHQAIPQPMTLSDTIRLMEWAAGFQPSVKSVVRNDIFRLNSLPDARYGVFGWTQGQHTTEAGANLYTYRFTLFYIDRLTADKGNETEVQSVGISTLDNVIRTIDDLGAVPSGDWQFTTFNQRFLDECAGVFCTVAFEVPVGSICAETFADFNEDFNEDFDIL